MTTRDNRHDGTAVPAGRWMLPDLRQLRLGSGIVLFAYVLLHLVNHSLGNLSIAAMESMLHAMKFIWQSPIGAVVLYAAMAMHLLLAFWALYERRYFRWSRTEACQLILGFCIPIMLANHILATRISLSLYETDKGYPIELYSFWVGNLPFGILQHVVLVVAWTHGCLGIYFWLRLKRWFAGWAPVLLVIAVALPMLALLGSFQQGRLVQEFAKDPAWRANYLPTVQVGTSAQNARLAEWRWDSWMVFGGAMALVVAARGIRSLLERRRGLVQLRYTLHRTLQAPLGVSILDVSNIHRIPHSSMCGGRGRCTTCRIQVLDHQGILPPPDGNEARMLERIAAPPGVRLACQLRPLGNLTLSLLMPVGGIGSPRRTVLAGGEERYLVMMFIDLRGSTSLADERLPFDTVFLLNSFLEAIGRAVVAAGGRPNQMLGDGMLALFGLEVGPEVAARQAAAALAGIARNMLTLNQDLKNDLRQPLEVGVGLHGGDVVVGDLGCLDHLVYTALGDAVNIAARLQSMTKEVGCDILVSEAVYQASGLAVQDWPCRTLAVRGRALPFQVRSARCVDFLQ